ncbi:MAG: prepilin-type N-terminal cleavage/methylation domain-containing protein [Patescibacteria group bacterium]
MLQKKSLKNNKGFTLIEIMVAVSIFAVIMVISAGAIISIFDSNRKSQSLRTVMDNVSLTMESMVRNIRFGTNYHCDITVGTRTQPLDCFGASGGPSLEVRSSDGKQIAYYLDDENERIVRTIDGGAEYYLTSEDMNITDLTFWVLGSPPYGGGVNNVVQPMVIIVIRGYSGDKPSSRSDFTLQTEVSQRTFDFQ